MLVRIIINTENDAFHADDCDCDNPGPARVTCDSSENDELGRILLETARLFSEHRPPYKLLDSNGSPAGTVEYI